MGKLIDEDALLKQLGISTNFNADVPPWVIGVIKGMPDVVRCKDCKYYDTHHHVCQRFEEYIECEHCERTFWRDLDLEFPEKGFCYYGERRRNGAED